MAETRRNNKGFTLIEITLAIFLLAVSLVTILGLQSSVMQRAINDSKKLQAMLIARRILASIESGETPATIQDTTGPVSLFLKPDSEEEEDDTSIQIQLRIEQWTIDAFPAALVNRVLVRIFWGEDSNQSLSVYYFIPSNESFDHDQDENLTNDERENG